MPKDRTVGIKGQKRGNLISIAKPNLAKEKYFNSKHTTPNDSIDNAK